MTDVRPPATRCAAPRVVVVHEHPLLGEGVARLLRGALGVDAVTVRADDAPATAAVLADGPRVVLVEHTGLLAGLGGLAPGAVVLDLLVGRPGRCTAVRVADVLRVVRDALAAPGGHTPGLYPTST